MKLLLTTLNSKYIHSSLALKCIYNNICDIKDIDINVKEYTINENIQDVFTDIISYNYDIVAFSCYIWNIEPISRICEDIKQINKNVKILLGGPEVSYESYNFMLNNDFVDYIIVDEGELIFRQFIKSYLDDKDFSKIPSFLYRDKNEIIENEYTPPIENLAFIKGPYDIFDENSIKDRIVYYETSRGCTYNCSYCLSSVTKKVRFFPYEKVLSDIKKIVDYGAKQIKFVDRTFNVDRKRTIDMIKYLCTLDNGVINFHFEITAHIMQDDLIDTLKNVREGLFQFEIGVQSTNKDTIKAVNRVDNFEKLSEKVKKIKSFGNIHQHLDLIAGLPYEDLESFKRSFDDVMSLRPDNLQLGFLKVLKGSPIKEKVEEFEIIYRNYPPYEVLSTKFLSYEDIFLLKEVESVLEDYYNSMSYNYSFDYIFDNINSSYFNFFRQFANFKKENNYNKNISRDDRFLLLFEYIKSIFSQRQADIFKEFLRLDYLLMGRNRNIPDFLRNGVVISPVQKRNVIFNSKLYNNRFAEENNTNANKFNAEMFLIDIQKYISTKKIDYTNQFVVFDYEKGKNFKNMVEHCFV